MAFSSIVSGTDTYEPRDEGVYSLSTLTFADPAQEIKLRGATRNRDGSLSGSISFVMEKDVTVNGSTVRKAMRIIVQPQTTTDFTAAELLSGITAIRNFASTAGYLDRFLQGES
jgi:hypothetical protein